jgi:hypothetical protein
VILHVTNPLCRIRLATNDRESFAFKLLATPVPGRIASTTAKLVKILNLYVSHINSAKNRDELGAPILRRPPKFRRMVKPSAEIATERNGVSLKKQTMSLLSNSSLPTLEPGSGQLRATTLV